MMSPHFLKAPANPYVDAFPTASTPTPCIAKELNATGSSTTAGNGLKTQPGVTSAYARSIQRRHACGSRRVEDRLSARDSTDAMNPLADEHRLEQLYLTTTAPPPSNTRLSRCTSSASRTRAGCGQCPSTA